MSARALAAATGFEPSDEDKRAAKILGCFLQVPGEARFIKPYWVALAAITMRSLYAKYRKFPRKRGFQDILAAAMKHKMDDRVPDIIERQATRARLFHMRYKDGTLAKPLCDWLDINAEGLTPSRTSPTTSSS